MDLIYATPEMVELGVIKDCAFDCAFGTDENSFECKVDISAHKCKQDYFIYFDGTEYGGIIDAIAVSTKERTVTYSGRTWHGILNSKTIYDYDFTGDGNDVLRKLIADIDLAEMFQVAEGESGIYIDSFHIECEQAYKSLLAALQTVGGALKFEHKDKMIEVSVVQSKDFSNAEEFDSTQIGFDAQKVYNLPNHFICRGAGDSADEIYQIHLFTNDNGEVQPYATAEQPLQDSDYILDESQKLSSGIWEYVEVVDKGSASEVNNYLPVDEEPENWAAEFMEYFYYEEEYEKYKEIEEEYADQYLLTKSKPADWDEYENFYYKYGYEYAQISAEEPPEWKADTYYTFNDDTDTYILQLAEPDDWETNWTDYFYVLGDNFECITNLISGVAYELLTSEPPTWKYDYSKYYELIDGIYSQVDLDEVVSYSKLKKRPSDWAKNYASYFYYYNDGTDADYVSIPSEIDYYYKVQTRKPTDWSTNYANYYMKNSKGKFESVKVTSYIRLQVKPKDWSKNYSDYYYYFSDGVSWEYRQITAKTSNVYRLQTMKPTDWTSNFDSYYYKKNGEYVKAQATTFTEVKKKPNNWRRKYEKYYYKYNDGVSTTYKKITGKNKYAYRLQKHKPTDWNTNYDSYFTKSGSNYKAVEGVKNAGSSDAVAPKWKEGRYYTRVVTTIAPKWSDFSHVYKIKSSPKWKKNTYYTKESVNSAPSFESFTRVYRLSNFPKWLKKKYYTRFSKNVAPPFTDYSVYKENVKTYIPKWQKNKYYDDYKTNDLTWAKNTYYRLLPEQLIIPEFVESKFYAKVIDHYAGLVQDGIEKIEAVYNCDSLNIELPVNMEYNINDVVGASEAITGIAIWQPINKKIVSLKGKVKEISYEVGGIVL